MITVMPIKVAPSVGYAWILVSQSELLGGIARWAVRQHPYHHPPGLLEVLDRWREATKTRFTFLGRCGLAWATQRSIVAMLETTLLRDEAFVAWNTPRSRRSGHAAVSATGGPAPEDDFIDLDALMRNVARDALVDWWQTHDKGPTAVPDGKGILAWAEPEMLKAELNHVLFVEELRALLNPEVES